MMRIRFGECALDLETRQLFVGGEETHLELKAFRILELLILSRPKVLSKNEIHQKLWPGTFVSDGTLTSLIADVRNTIGDDARQSRFVRTVHGFGYGFCGEAQEADSQAPLESQRSSCWLIRGRRRYALATGESIVGRDHGAAVFVDDHSVSRRHAIIRVSDEGVTLEDLGSKNGTHVGEKLVRSPVPLADGDRIRFGTIEWLLRIFPMPDSTMSAVKAERPRGDS